MEPDQIEYYKIYLIELEKIRIHLMPKYGMSKNLFDFKTGIFHLFNSITKSLKFIGENYENAPFPAFTSLARMAVDNYSVFYLLASYDTLENQKLVRERMEREFQFPIVSGNCCTCFHIRTPDYFVRTESLYEDYLTIPFIKNHDINLSGELERLCKEKINSSPAAIENYWKKFYDQDMADLVYYNNVNSFKLFGYNKDSWKD